MSTPARRNAGSQIIVPAAGLQDFERGVAKHQSIAQPLHWREDVAWRLLLEEDSFSLPWELAYARALGLPSEDGKIPWAAWETQTMGIACAWVYPCHLDVGMMDLVLAPPDRLALSQAQSQELLTLLAPHFALDGITLRYHSAQRWLAMGEPFTALACASVQRAQGCSINAFLPQAGASPTHTELARLQAQVQMLLYSHPINDARSSAGLATINSFWVDGAGRLDGWEQPERAIFLETKLQQAVGEPMVYAQTWQSLMRQWTQESAQALASGQDWCVTLCSPMQAMTWRAEKTPWTRRLMHKMTRAASPDMRWLLEPNFGS